MYAIYYDTNVYLSITRTGGEEFDNAGQKTSIRWEVVWL